VNRLDKEGEIYEMEEKLFKRDTEGGYKRGKEEMMGVVGEQLARGVVHMLQFGVSHCFMLLLMYSNGENKSFIILFSLWVERFEKLILWVGRICKFRLCSVLRLDLLCSREIHWMLVVMGKLGKEK
jgi:hypothetical protein